MTCNRSAGDRSHLAGRRWAPAWMLFLALSGVPVRGQQAPTPPPVSGGPAQPAQPAAPNPGVTTIRVTAREVLLDVLVTDKYGRPISGLTAADFSVAEEGNPQTVRSVQEHQSMGPADLAKLQPLKPLPPNTFSNFTPALNTNSPTVILLDALDSDVQTQMYARLQLIDYLKHMQPGASIAIFQLDTELHLIQGFSSDQQVLLEAAKSKRDMPTLLKPAHGPDNSEYRRIRRIILREAFRELGRYLAAFPGRKNLIWLTGEEPLARTVTGLGNPFRDTFDVVDDDAGSSGAKDILTISHVAIYPVDARGLLNAGPREAARIGFENSRLDQVAQDTGGRAYYSNNAVKDAIAQIIGYGSNYYTLAYSTTNTDWNREYRHIRISVDRPGVELQYRHGYYAVNRDRQEERKLAALQKHRAQSAGKSGEPAASEPSDEDKAADEAQDEQEKADANEAAAETDAAAEKDAAAKPDGALVHPVKSGLAASMALGAVPATEIVFSASLAPDDQVLKLDRNATLPPDNYLRPGYRDKPFRNYSIAFHTDVCSLKLTRTPDGIRHGSVDFVSVVYGQSGEVVNSQLGSATLDLNDATYRELLKSGLQVRQKIAVPVKGNYFLRLGVHDAAADQIGALEIPIDRIKPGLPAVASGNGRQTP